jgi:TRAP-type C4-dicarboxylate transport system permease small subunit
MSGPRSAAMRKTLDFLYDAAGYLAAFFVFAIFVVMIGGTIMRELGLRTGGSDDIVAWFCAAAAFLAMAHTFRRGDFVRVVIGLDRLGPAARRRMEAVCLLIMTAFVAFLTFAGLKFVYESFAFNDMANGMIAIPLWIPQSSFVVGTVLLLIAVVDELVIALRGATPTYIIAAEERHARGDFTEDL